MRKHWGQKRLWEGIALWLFLSILAHGAISADEIASDYFGQIAVFSDGRITRFREMPIRIHILTPPDSHRHYRQDLEYALNQWQRALPGVLVFRTVDQADEAQIAFRWTTHNLNQMTDHALGDAKLVRLDDEGRYRVEVTASLRDKRTGNPLSSEEMRTVCLHELGHALGLWGHSPAADDVMFYASRAQSPTARDALTLQRIYSTPPHTPVHDRAIGVLREWIAQSPDTPRFHYMLGGVYQDAERYDEAIDAFLRCLELDLSHKAAGQRLVDCYKNLGRTQDAMKQAEQMLRVDPSPEAHNTAGVLYHEGGDIDRALACFRKALSLDPRHRRARHNLLGLIRERAAQALERGEHSAVLLLAQEGLRLDPADGHLWLSQGIAHAGLKQYAMAIRDYEEALRFDPHSPAIQENMGRTYNNWAVDLVQRKNYREAIENYRNAQRCCPHLADISGNIEDAYWRMAREYAAAGQTLEAIRAYRELLQRNPELPEAHAILGELQSKQGDYPAAIESFRAAIEVKPDFSEARHNLLVTHILGGQEMDKQGRYDQAIAMFEGALSLKPDYLDAHLLLAQTYRHAERMDEALEVLERASALDPSNEQIQKSIANVYIQRGNKAMRRKNYGSAISAFSKIPDAQKSVDIHNTLAYLHLVSGDFMGAIPALRAAMVTDPGNDTTYQNLRSLESQLYRKFDPRPGKEAPGVRDQLALARVELARCLLGRGEYTPAKDMLRSALDLEAGDPGTKRALLELATRMAKKLREIQWPKNATEIESWIREISLDNTVADENPGT